MYAVAGLVLLVLLTFAPLRHNHFTTFDDDIWIGKNAALNPPSFEGLLAKWTDPFDGKSPGVFQALYTPLCHSLWFVAALAGHRAQLDGLNIALDPVPFRVLSLLVHLLAGAGVYRLLRSLSLGPALALFLAGIFLLHPMQVEAVAWASGLKDLLWSALMAWALAAWVQWLRHRPSHLPWLAVGLGGLALLAKPTAVVIPAMFAWLWWCVGRRPGDPVWPPPKVRTALIASLAMALPMAVLTAWFQTAETVQPVAWWQRPLVALDALGHYLATLVYPVGLTIDYARTPTWTVAQWRWLPYATLTVLTGVAVAASRSRRVWAGAGLAVLAVAPVLGLKDFDYATFTVVTDHYGYAWMVGVVVAAGAGLHHVVDRACRASGQFGDASGFTLSTSVRRHPGRAFSWAVCCAAVVLHAGLAVLSHRQTQVWRDSGTLYLHGLSVQPRSAIINSNYASHLYTTAKLLPKEQRQPLIEAMRVHAARALETWPEFPQAHYLSGMAAAILGEPRVALRHYVRAATYYARRADFQVKVADVYAELGRLDEAEKHYREALRLEPGEATATRMLERIAEYRRQER